jgi:hypothetical protein
VEVDHEKEELRRSVVRLEFQLLQQMKANVTLMDQMEERVKFLERLIETMAR